MKNFDLHRFGQALKCQLMVGRKLWIRLFLLDSHTGNVV